MNTVYTATCGADILAFNDSLTDLLDWVGDIHEDGEDVAVWRGPVLVLVIDGAGHTTYLTDPEAHRV
jgi:hypothetical protein